VAACLSELVRIEFAQAMKGIANTPTAMSEAERRRRRLHRWSDDREARLAWHGYCQSEFDRLLEQFSIVDELAITSDIIAAATPLMAESHLDSFDSVHVVSALAAGADTLATLDADYLRIAGVAELAIALIR
jgi:predicted nucleic acid-binding protein